MRVASAGLLATVMIGAAGLALWRRQASAPEAIPADALNVALPDRYDPSRDPARDLLVARAQAKESQRNIFVIVGGDWCSWCHELERFFGEHTELAELRGKNYVVMKVSMSQENPNRAFLSRYPQIHGYPHIFIFDAEGKLIRSQPTNELEAGRSYRPQRMREFLMEFGPKAAER
jgi:thiol:disulfide interchange protein